MSQSSSNIRVGAAYVNKDGSRRGEVTAVEDPLSDRRRRTVRIKWSIPPNFYNLWYTEEEVVAAVDEGAMVPCEPEFL